MDTLSEYDLAAADYYKKAVIKTVPILSWDFHHEFVSELLSIQTDAFRLQEFANTFRWDNSWDFAEKLQKKAILVTDLDLKIVFASENMKQMNGYKATEVLGNSPKMFQGKETDLKVSQSIREAVQKRESFETNILNYKKNGSTYTCHVQGFPVFDKSGKLCHFIAFENAA